VSERFYIAESLAIGPVIVEGAEAHHLAAVCRLRAGDRVCLFNGDGHQYPAVVGEVGKRHVSLEVRAIESPQTELGFRLEVAVPLPKGDRAQFLIEKLTELGVTHFVPLQTQRSVVHPRDTGKLQRWVIEASKQCGRNVLMQVGSLCTWETYCRREGLPETCLLADPGGDSWRRSGPVGDIAVAVGPEGGFTDDEIQAGRAANWRVIALGPRLLRVETAALVLAALASSTEERPP
jgi:16S rRNA (uracil1498-N3)-methyltransferase